MIMKSIVVLSCVVAAALAASTYDYNVDVKEIIGSERLLDTSLKCVLDEGKCTPELKNLKGDLQEGLGNGCAKCTEKQKDDVATLCDHVIKNKPDIWEKLIAKYDPSGVYRKKYEDEARSRGIVYN